MDGKILIVKIKITNILIPVVTRRSIQDKYPKISNMVKKQYITMKMLETLG
jgi:hypothetical protein